MDMNSRHYIQNGILILLFVGILIALFHVFSEKSQDPLKSPDAQLGIKDTASIYAITIERYEANRLIERRTLEKKGGQWIVDGTFPADPFRIKNLLETFYFMEPREVPNPKASENFRKFLKQTHFLVHIKRKGHSDLKYYVGSMTMDGIGTIMLKAGSLQPYVFHIPGFHGYLGSRYATPLPLWVDRTLFVVKPEELKRIQLTSNLWPEYQFELIRSEQGSWRFRDNSPLDQQALAQYLSHFGHIYADAVILDREKEKVDSLSRIPPDFTFELETFTPSTITLHFYFLPDSANYLAVRIQDKRLFKVQQYAFGEHFFIPKKKLLKHQ